MPFAIIVCNSVYDNFQYRMLFLVRIVHSEPRSSSRRPAMPNARASAVATMEEPRDAAGVVEAFLHASMVPDPQTAARYIADDLKITFTGGRKYRHPRETRRSTPSATSG